MFNTFQCPECGTIWGLDELVGIAFPFHCPNCDAEITDDDLVTEEEDE